MKANLDETTLEIGQGGGINEGVDRKEGADESIYGS